MVAVLLSALTSSANGSQHRKGRHAVIHLRSVTVVCPKPRMPPATAILMPSSSTPAGCQTTSQGTITQDNRVITTHSDSPKSAICRIWPAHPELTLAAVPLMTQQYSDYDNVGDMELLVLDSTTLDVKQRLRLPERMSDDAIRITGWHLIPLAGRLRLNRPHSACVSPAPAVLGSIHLVKRHFRCMSSTIISSGQY